MKKLVLLFAALLVAGCGEKSSSDGSESVSENPTAPSEEVKPEEPVAETKPAEEAPVNPIKYKIAGDVVTITDCDRNASGALIIPAAIEGKPVTSIGNWAFAGINLTSITIPGSVTIIGINAFAFCSSLTTIEVDAGNVNYTDVDGVLFNTEKTVLLTYPAGKTGANYTIPDSVTSIGRGAFHMCKNLTSITIPDSVTSIGDHAFDGCRSLTAVTFLGDAPEVGNKSFSTLANTTIYRKSETKGWGDTFADRPVKLISEKP